MSLMKKLWSDEAGFVVSAELVLIATIVVIGLIVGLSEVQHAVVSELNDVANSIGSLDQTFSYASLVKSTHAAVPGSAFADRQDACDCTAIHQVAPQPKLDCSGVTAENN